MGQEEQKQNEVKGIKCPKGHDLKQQVMVDDSYHCDKCRKRDIAVGSNMYGCANCCYDICEQCYFSKNLDGIKSEVKNVKGTMESQLVALKKQQEELKKQEAIMEDLKIQSQSDFFGFLEKSGMSPSDIQQMIGSDSDSALALLKKKVDEQVDGSIKKDIGGSMISEDLLDKIDIVAEGVQDISATGDTDKIDEFKRIEEKEEARARKKKKERAEKETTEKKILESNASISTHTFDIQQVCKDGNQVFVICIQLPSGSSMSDLDLDISDTALELSSSANIIAPTHILFPAPGDSDSASAKFISKRSVLKVTIPLCIV